MWKMLIADDEPKIRRGLARLISLLNIDVEVIGEAEDGEIALELIKQHSPHVILVDICMPFLNGLELVEEVRKINPNCIVIVITGFDEFSYAQQAIKLGVFDYLLKPIVMEQLQSVLHKAIEQLEHRASNEKYSTWTNNQLKKNLPILRERFLDEWMNGLISVAEMKEQMDYFNISLTDGAHGVIVMKLAEKTNIQPWDHRQLALFAVQNVLSDLLNQWNPNLLFKDHKDHIVSVIPYQSGWGNLSKIIIEKIEEVLNLSMKVEMSEANGGLTGIGYVYEELINRMERGPSYSPLVQLAKRYIDTHFHKVDLSLKEVADSIGVSPAYLSRLLRQDIGSTFIDYLSQSRIQHALELLNDPTVKIYEVAEKVGYNGQHYFCTVFKKVLGISPLEYRKGGKRSL
jgi:two-component system, response regulator YesN